MAVDQSVFQTQGAAGGGPVTYFTKDKNGVVAEVEIARDQFKPPATGFYLLKLKAFSAPFEMDGQFGKSKNVRAVFVVKAPGTFNDKAMFSQLLSVAKVSADGNWRSNITANSAVGKMIAAIRGTEIQDGEPINLLDYLNGEFAAMVNQSTKQGQNGIEVYGNVVKDTWQPASAVAGQQAAPQPVAAAAPAGGAAGNVFLDDDD